MMPEGPYEAQLVEITGLAHGKVLSIFEKQRIHRRDAEGAEKGFISREAAKPRSREAAKQN
jgi:hypothetical protein